MTTNGFKEFLKLVIDWDEYIYKLEQEDLLEEGTANKIYEFMNSLYTCAAVILVHGTNEQVLNFVNTMNEFGKQAETIKSELLRDEETEVEDESIHNNRQPGIMGD
jgi:hypothetical protein